MRSAGVTKIEKGGQLDNLRALIGSELVDDVISKRVEEDERYVVVRSSDLERAISARVSTPSRGVGTILERMLKPLARKLSLMCLDDNGQLRKNSGCARRRDWLNKLGQQ